MYIYIYSVVKQTINKYTKVLFYALVVFLT